MIDQTILLVSAAVASLLAKGVSSGLEWFRSNIGKKTIKIKLKTGETLEIAIDPGMTPEQVNVKIKETLEALKSADGVNPA